MDAPTDDAGGHGPPDPPSLGGLPRTAPRTPRPGGSWRDALTLPEEQLQLLPRGYDVVGHVVLVKLPAEARHLGPEVGRALLDKVPATRTAAADYGVQGELRTRRVEVLAGEPQLLTEHRENGCRLLVDLATCYYSPRLAGERGRIAALVRPDEDVCDLYCGVGPYAVLLARAGARVRALEMNSVAARLARTNAARNKVAGRVDVILGDSPALAAAMPPTFDRAVLNLPHDAVAHLARVLPCMGPGGVLHVGAMLPKDDAEAQAAEIAARHDLTLERLVLVRNYNPAVGHYTLDVRLE